ncbi:precorrin-6A synthase (deacetylating) [Luteococcus sp. Sow4_B9]|uniref:precorrin-6A synthase (deacetylating) n=1 Tax=Luteococcus sp. Sow4_B9 TaxID=3438792 RepID=UPI003F9C0965
MRIRVLGVGMGPQHVTAEVARALREADYLVAFDKTRSAGARVGDGSDEILAVRQRIADAHDTELVTVPDPERDRTPADYQGAVAAWHRARLDALEAVLRERSTGLPDGGCVGFLAWGDPAFYDSTVRIVEQVAERLGATWDVLPGISAPQLLAARHRISLHAVGQPVHITTVRRLPEAIAAGQRNVVAMLGEVRWGDPPLDELGDWQVWWGANLGTDSEQLVHGTVRDVSDHIGWSRERARQQAGWVMDLCLLRGPQ